MQLGGLVAGPKSWRYGLWRAALAAVAASLVALLGVSVALGAAAKVVGGRPPTPVATGKAVRRRARPAATPISLNLDLAVRERAALQQLIVAASTPGSPSYGHYLSKSQYMARFAPTSADVESVSAWARGEHLRVTGVSKDNLLVHVRGPTAAVEHAFNVAVGEFTADGRNFFSAESAPSVPADLPVAGVRGLSNFERPRPAYTCVNGECGFLPPEFRTLYDIQGSGEGQTIAFTLWGTPLTEEYFEKEAAITKAPALALGAGPGQIEFHVVGGTNKMSEGEEGDIHQETALDSEVAHEVAPKAHETYWLAADEENSFGLSLQTAQDEAANSSAKVISKQRAPGLRVSDNPGTAG